MTYRIEGLNPENFAGLFAMDAAGLESVHARRVTAGADMGWPCRVSLLDAKVGESLILLHHLSHDVATPYRSAYAMYVREAAAAAATFVDETPPVFEGRPMAFRAFNSEGMLVNAALALPGQADNRIRELLEDDRISYIHAHNAAHGCFSARIDRS